MMKSKLALLGKTLSFGVLSFGFVFQGFVSTQAMAQSSVGRPSDDGKESGNQYKVESAKPSKTNSSTGTSDQDHVGSSTGAPSSSEDLAPSIALPPPTPLQRLGKGCQALQTLKPQTCEGWSGYPSKQPFPSCRDEANSNLAKARAALTLAELYENRGKKTEEQIRAELVEKLQTDTEKGGVQLSQQDAVALADQLITNYKSSEQAYRECQDRAADSSWQYNMLLAGAVSTKEFNDQRADVQTCNQYIESATSKAPSYNDVLTEHVHNSQPKLQNYINNRKAKSQARNWDLGVAFDKINSNLPDGYRGQSWDVLGYKLYSIDLYNKCQGGGDRTRDYGEGGSKIKNFFKDHWGKLLVGGLAVLVGLCLTENLPFSFCKDKKAKKPKIRRPATTTTTSTTASTTSTTSTTATTATTSTTAGTTSTTAGTTSTTAGTTATTSTTAGTTSTTSTTAGTTSTTSGTTSSVTTTTTTTGTTSTTATTTTSGGLLPPNVDFGQGSGGTGNSPRTLAPTGRTLAPQN